MARLSPLKEEETGGCRTQTSCTSSTDVHEGGMRTIWQRGKHLLWGRGEGGCHVTLGFRSCRHRH